MPVQAAQPYQAPAPQAVQQQAYQPSQYGQVPAALQGPLPSGCPPNPAGTCPYINFEQRVEKLGGEDHRIFFRALTGMPVELVDVHWRLLNSAGLEKTVPMNIRLNKLTEQTFETRLQMSAGDRLEYWFTYCVCRTDCDTDTFVFGGAAPAPLVQTPYQAPQPVKQQPLYNYQAPAAQPVPVVPAPMPVKQEIPYQVPQPYLQAPAPQPVQQGPYVAPAPLPVQQMPYQLPQTLQQPAYPYPQLLGPAKLVQASPYRAPRTVYSSISAPKYSAPQPQQQQPYSAPQPIQQQPYSVQAAPQQPIMQSLTGGYGGKY
jgi:hypothetical protein